MTHPEKLKELTDEGKATLVAAFRAVSDRLQAECGAENGKEMALMIYQMLLVDLSLPEAIDHEFLRAARTSLAQELQGIVATALVRHAEAQTQAGLRSAPEHQRRNELARESIAHFKRAISADLAMMRDLPSQTAVSLVLFGLQTALIDFAAGDRPISTEAYEAAMSAFSATLCDIFRAMGV